MFTTSTYETKITKERETMLKKSKVILSFALALVMCFASLITTFAAPGAAVQTSQAAINKFLMLPKGTDIPANFHFDFTVTPVSVDNEAATETNMPNPGTFSIKFDGTQTLKQPEGDINTYYKESEDIFGKVTFPHPGVYVYEVTEKSDSYQPDAIHEKLTFSEAKYTLNVYVRENDKGEYYIAFIGAMMTVKDDGTDISKDDQVKVDPTPGGKPDVDGDYSEMIFTNTYVKTNGTETPENPDPKDPDQATLSISKTVVGEYGSKTEYFKFNLTVNTPTLVYDPAKDDASKAPVYNAYVVEEKTANVYEIIGSPIAFTSGTPVDFQLRHNQKLVFVNTPVGTKYAVTEAGAANYTPSYVIKTNGIDAATVPGSMNTSLTADNQYVGEAANLAAYTNTRDEVTPTGLNLNDLPFIGMIILALGAAIAFIVVKARKRNYN